MSCRISSTHAADGLSVHARIPALQDLTGPIHLFRGVRCRRRLALDFRQGDKEQCFPSLETIAKDTGLHRSRASESIPVLEETRVLEVERKMGAAIRERAWCTRNGAEDRI